MVRWLPILLHQHPLFPRPPSFFLLSPLHRFPLKVPLLLLSPPRRPEFLLPVFRMLPHSPAPIPGVYAHGLITEVEAMIHWGLLPPSPPPTIAPLANEKSAPLQPIRASIPPPKSVIPAPPPQSPHPRRRKSILIRLWTKKLLLFPPAPNSAPNDVLCRDRKSDGAIRRLVVDCRRLDLPLHPIIEDSSQPPHHRRRLRRLRRLPVRIRN